MRGTSPRAVRVGTMVVLLALVATACQRVEATLYDASHRPEVALRYVTRDGSDRYVATAGPGTLKVSAPSSNQATPNGSATRAVIWPPSTKAVQDQQSCATWTSTSGSWVQQGLALRVRIDGSRFRTIVVAKNTYYGAEWQMNVYTWDTARSPYFVVHGAVDLRAPFELGDVPRPLPWKVCAKVEGRVVRIKGWRADESEPGWTNPSHTGAVTLPSSWVFSGKAGWYAGHIMPGGQLSMADLRTSGWVLQTTG